MRKQAYLSLMIALLAVGYAGKLEYDRSVDRQQVAYLESLTLGPVGHSPATSR